MKITKTFCDNCEKEIKDTDPHIEVEQISLVKWNHFKLNHHGRFDFKGDVCSVDCLIKRITDGAKGNP